MQAGLSHDAQQTYCFQSNCLASRIGPGDHQNVKLITQPNINGYHFASQQRMACLLEVNKTAIIQARFGTVLSAAVLGSSKDGIQPRRGIESEAEMVRVVSDCLRQLAQNPLSLSLFRLLSKAQFVVEFHGESWFHEHRGAACRLVVHNALELAAILTAHRNYVASSPDRDNRVLQHLLGGRRMDQSIQSVANPVRQSALLLANAGQLWRSVVSHHTLFIKTARNLGSKTWQGN